MSDSKKQPALLLIDSCVSWKPFHKHEGKNNLDVLTVRKIWGKENPNGSVSVSDPGDEAIYRYAQILGRTIVTRDSDFRSMARNHDTPHKGIIQITHVKSAEDQYKITKFIAENYDKTLKSGYLVIYDGDKNTLQLIPHQREREHHLERQRRPNRRVRNHYRPS